MKRYTPNSKSKDEKSRSSKMTPQVVTMDGKNIHLIVGGSKDDPDEPRKSSEKVIIVGGSKDDLDEPRKSSEKVNVFGVSQHDFDERNNQCTTTLFSGGAESHCHTRAGKSMSSATA